MGKQSDSAITVEGAIQLYEQLLSVGRLTKNGAGHKRLEVLREVNRRHRYFPKNKKLKTASLVGRQDSKNDNPPTKVGPINDNPPTKVGGKV
tara:strand:- start:6 stop:281 length:276 start_codon:yes stop_codon:yes gene_type:complete